MAVIDDIICVEKDNTISFGDYVSKEKRKKDDFKTNGDIYKVKTHNELTRLEKNTKLLMETVPGATIHNFKLTEKIVSFKIEGFEDTKITMELEAEKEYKVLIDNVNVGSMKSNFSGKVNFSMELNSSLQEVKIEKVM